MGAGVMLVCRHKTLILKRANYKGDKWSGYWNFPGGQGEPNESPYETALRETYEETEISSDQYRVVDHVEDRYYTMFIGLCKEELVPTLDHEHTEWRWVSIDTIPRLAESLHPKDWRSFKRKFC